VHWRNIEFHFEGNSMAGNPGLNFPPRIAPKPSCVQSGRKRRDEDSTLEVQFPCRIRPGRSELEVTLHVLFSSSLLSVAISGTTKRPSWRFRTPVVLYVETAGSLTLGECGLQCT